MELLENYNSAKAKYGEIADKMRAARIADRFLLSACRFYSTNGVSPERLFEYFHQWCIYVLRHDRIDVNKLNYEDFRNKIREYKNRYGVPNQIYNDGKVVIGELKSHKDLAYFPVRTPWCIAQAEMFAKYTNDPKAYSMYIIDNGEIGKPDSDRYVCMQIDKYGVVSYWTLYNEPMMQSTMREYEETLTFGASSFIGELCEKKKAMSNDEQEASFPVTESQLRCVVKECVKRILRERYEDDSSFGWNWVYDIYKDNVDGETMKAIKKSYDRYGEECAAKGEIPNSVGFKLWMAHKDVTSCEKGEGVRFPNYF